MEKNEYLVSMVKKEIRVLVDVKNAISNLKLLDRYLKPSTHSRLGNNYHELDSYNDFLLRMKYHLLEQTYNLCARIYSEYSKNLNGSGRVGDSQRITSDRLSAVKKIADKIIELNSFVENLE